MVKIGLASERNWICAWIHLIQRNTHEIVNIVTGEVVYHPSVNADQAVALGKQQCKEFEAGWPDSFYDTISRVVNPMSVSGKFIDVCHSKVFDTGVLYARAMG